MGMTTGNEWYDVVVGRSHGDTFAIAPTRYGRHPLASTAQHAATGTEGDDG